MKEQYVGDVNDFRKYALLRALASDRKTKIGVVWMLAPPDGGNDGKRNAYLGDETYRAHDPELFDVLRGAQELADGTRLTHIESSGVLPGATFVNEILPDGLLERMAYFRRVAEAMSGVDLVFFDPDNGLDVPSRGKGSRHSSKYLYRDELAEAYARGNSVLVYQHFPRSERSGFTDHLLGELNLLCSGSKLWAFATPHVVFLLVVHPAHQTAVGASARAAATKWSTSFIRGFAFAG